VLIPCSTSDFNVRIEMISSSFIAQPDSLRLGASGRRRAAAPAERYSRLAWRNDACGCWCAASQFSRIGQVARCVCRVFRRRKSVGYVAPLLARNGCRIAGIYMTGANEDHLSDGYARIQPGGSFLNTPIYISAGHDDRIAKRWSSSTLSPVQSSEPGFDRRLHPRQPVV